MQQGVRDLPLQKNQPLPGVRDLIDIAPFPIVILNPKGEVALWNPAAERVFGWTQWEAMGKPMPTVSAASKAMFELGLRGRLEGGRIENLVIEPRRKDGVLLRLSLTSVPLKDGGGKVIGLLDVFSDLSVDILARSEIQKLSTAVEQSPVVVVITDRQGSIEYVNARFTELSGYAKEEVLGKNPRMLKSGFTSDEEYVGLWKTISSGATWRGELQNKKKNGETYWVSAAISALKNSAGEITQYLAMQEDITEKKQLQAQYLQVQKMEGVGQLAGGIAHDFNNLLTVILGNAELLLLAAGPNDASRGDLEQIRDTARRAADLTRQLLAFSRRQVIAPRVVSLNTLVLGMDKMLRRLIPENVALEIVPEAAQDTVKIDPGQLEQVLVNLAVNARDAMPSGGRLLIRTYNLSCVEVMLSVSDTGVGMSEQVKGHIFEPFFTTKAPGKGTGLGLATCYGIAKQSGGALSVDSELGRGTKMTLSLPLAGEAAWSQESSRSEELPRGHETVLMVEDEPAVLQFARRILTAQGYIVLAARNGEEAIGILEDEKIQVDLILTDVVMPQMGGVKLSQWLHEHRPRTKILFMSGYTDSGIVELGVLKPGCDFLPKPFSREELAQKVREVLEAKTA